MLTGEAGRLERQREACRKYRHTERGKWTRRKRRAVDEYGLSEEEFDSIADRVDNGPCEICGMIGRMDIDHDHDNKRFRGLICHQCNVMLGMANDNPTTLRRASDYLEARSIAHAC